MSAVSENHLEGCHGSDALLGVQLQHALQQLEGASWQPLALELVLQEPPEPTPERRMLAGVLVSARAAPLSPIAACAIKSYKAHAWELRRMASDSLQKGCRGCICK